jgi:cardiolipin synthase
MQTRGDPGRPTQDPAPAIDPRDSSRRDVAPDPLRRVATVPNLISAIRIGLIPVFVALLLDRDTEVLGLVLLAMVVATDWIDGTLARRLGQVSNVGKLLDPVADRLALGAALITLVIRDAFPVWAAAIVVGRDALLLVAGALLLVRTGVRIDVRRVGKAATFGLMAGIPLIAWGNFHRAFGDAALVVGWAFFLAGLVLYLLATAAYVNDARRALATRRL